MSKGEASFGLYYYNARWYDTALGRFAQADSIVPGGVQGLDRYAYVNNNSLVYVDPSGHKSKKNTNGLSERILRHERNEVYYDYSWDLARQDYLFSLLFPGLVSGSMTWTPADWLKYNKHRNNFWINPPTNETFPEITERFVSLYSNSQKELLVRDFALMFGGVPESKSWPVAIALSIKRPPLPYLHIKNTGLPDYYLDNRNKENQSHHFSAFFMVGYYTTHVGGAIGNAWRDSNNPGDIILGNEAAYYGYQYSLSSDISLIVSYVNLVWGK